MRTSSSETSCSTASAQRPRSSACAPGSPRSPPPTGSHSVHKGLHPRADRSAEHDVAGRALDPLGREQLVDDLLKVLRVPGGDPANQVLWPTDRVDLEHLG